MHLQDSKIVLRRLLFVTKCTIRMCLEEPTNQYDFENKKRAEEKLDELFAEINKVLGI